MKTYTEEEIKAVSDRDERVYTVNQAKMMIRIYLFILLMCSYVFYSIGYDTAIIDLKNGFTKQEKEDSLPQDLRGIFRNDTARSKDF